MTDTGDILYVGIDFGSLRSYVGILDDNDEVQIVKCEEEKTYLPTFVSYSKPHAVEVGTAAQEDRSSRDTIYFVKQLLGRKFDDESQIANLPNGHSRPIIINREPHFQLTSGRTVTPADVYVEILKKIKTILRNQFPSKRFLKAVITVPSNTSSAFRSVIRNGAGKNGAGFDDVCLLTDVSAAVVAYNLEAESSGYTIAIVDIGASSTEISIADFHDSRLNILTNVSESVGGIHFDNAVVDYVLQKLNQPDPNESLRSRVRLACLTAKVELGDEKRTTVTVEGFENSPVPLNRDKFNSLNADNFNRVILCAQRALREASLDVSQVGHLAVVGGSSKIPRIVALLEGFFKKKIIDDSKLPFEAEEAIVYGATYEAARLFEEGDNLVILD